MCRWIAYSGAPIALERLVIEPEHSLVAQSQHATRSKTGTNGDGFGIGWYGSHETPGLYRDVLPAWSDENLKALCRHIVSGRFFAHVRASTGTASTRANCHPFALGRWLFMHNGQIGGYDRIRRRVEALIPDCAYGARRGTTDSEAIFLAAAPDRSGVDPVTEVARVLGEVCAMMREADIVSPLRFTAALSDGQTLYAFRWSSDEHAPSLYFLQGSDGLMVVSEPLDDQSSDWTEVPAGHVVVARAGAPARCRPFDVPGSGPALRAEAAE